MSRVAPLGGAAPSRIGIIVAGMHRSGTSATARLINLLGADITRKPMPSDSASNDRGFWESGTITTVHEQLLRGLGSAWDDPLPLPHDWLEFELTRRTKDRLAREIEEDFAASRVFVTKDPRVMRLLPLWLELFDDLGIAPVVVIPFRNPLEVAGSLQKRDQFAAAKSLLLYACSYLDAELASRDRPRLFVHFEQLLTDWRPFATRLARHTGGPWQPPAEAADAINRYLSAGLRHNRTSRRDLGAVPGIPATVIAIYDRMVEASGADDDAVLRRSFDDCRANVGEAIRLFQGLLANERELRRDALAPARQLNALAEAQGAEVNRLADALTQSQGRVAELEAALAQSRGRIGELEGVLRTRAVGLADARNRAAMWEANATHAQAELAAITRSTSWRATGPLRRARRIWSRVMTGLATRPDRSSRADS